jgi:hypothetical protein
MSRKIQKNQVVTETEVVDMSAKELVISRKGDKIRIVLDNFSNIYIPCEIFEQYQDIGEITLKISFDLDTLRAAQDNTEREDRSIARPVPVKARPVVTPVAAAERTPSRRVTKRVVGRSENVSDDSRIDMIEEKLNKLIGLLGK